MSDDQQIHITQEDRLILRDLAAQLAEAAHDPVHTQKARLWQRLNDLQSVRPMVWITEIPWQEMNVDNELTLRTSGRWARDHETWLRRELYQWRHLPVDMILSNYISNPAVIHDTGLGLTEQVDIVRTEEDNPIVSRHFHRQLVEPKDVEKIKDPIVTFDAEATEANDHFLSELYDGIFPVRTEAMKFIWFTPWDYLIQWWGVQEAMMDLVLRPDMVHEAVSRFVSANLCRLDQWERLGLLTSNNDNTRIGSGGYGYVSDLPAPDPTRAAVQPSQMWGCSNAQIFSEVSPQMHWDFAIQHDLPWLERWGLNYYGCCEPLHHKIEILRRIPNLRKISMSPWIDRKKAVEAVGADYVFSYKPNPAVFAETTWRPEIARAELEEILDLTRHCHVELILKDISTVRHEPQRLWQWAQMAIELAETYAR